MNTSPPATGSARSALAGLIDYAGLFPPAALSLAAAREEYAAARTGLFAWMLGRFIISASQLASLEARLEEPLSAIVDAGTDPVAWLQRAQELLARIAASRAAGAAVELLEVPLPRLVRDRDTFDAAIGQLRVCVDRAGLGDLPVYAEIPRSARWAELLPGAMQAAARWKVYAKLRCGGLTADAFPSVREVAEFVAAAAQSRVAFKATAGLHHPVRGNDPASGFTMHGFLNLLAAAAFAPRVDRATLERIVAEEDPRAFSFDDLSFAWRNERISSQELRDVRRDAFHAYGSCSFSEPVDDLRSLGLLQ
ncbi:MAG: hypothetical protein WA814_06945 [Candidatus Baltobacteraceae bacterium]